MRWFALVAALLTVTGSAGHAEIPDQIAILEKAVPKALARHRAEGAAVALVADGEATWSAGFGVANAAAGEAVTVDTVFEAASVAKPVTAWAVLRLAEQGRLDLDAPIERYITRWSLPPSDFDQSAADLARFAAATMPGPDGAPPGRGVISPASVAMTFEPYPYASDESLVGFG